MAHKVIALAHLAEIVRLLEQQGEFADFFWQKVQAAQIHKDPYFRPLG